MTYNRKPCAALFLEGEYDALILEAYSEARVNTEKLKNGRYPFSCTFCKEIHKDKNMTSYHRMFNLCKVYKGVGALKMYPTWEKSDHGELNRVAKKYGKFFQQNVLCKLSAAHKRDSEDDLHLSSLKRRKLTSTTAPKPQIEVPCKMSRSRVSHEEDEMKKQEIQDPLASAESDDHTAEGSHQQSAGPSIKDESEEETPPVVHRDSPEVRSTSEGAGFCVVKHKRSERVLTRKDIEERAWVKARLKFPDNKPNCHPPPPPPEQVNALYILLSEVDLDWLPKDLLNEPEVCMSLLYKMVEDGSLVVKVGSAFGRWYLHKNLVRIVIVIQGLPTSFNMVLTYYNVILTYYSE